MARPTLYSDELRIEICARSTEGLSLKTICDDPMMPSLRTVIAWRDTHPEFSALLDRSILGRATTYLEESVDISDEEVLDSAQAMRQKTRVGARQWAAARLNPAKYAEKIGIGAAPEMPPPYQPPMSNLEAARRIVFLLESGRLEAEKQGQIALAEQLRGSRNLIETDWEPHGRITDHR